MTKVRENSRYVFTPVGMDIYDSRTSAVANQVVRVINLYGAPKCNTMGQAHIEDATTKKFLGMVCTNSLTLIKTN
jgi:hypothetical protein